MSARCKPAAAAAAVAAVLAFEVPQPAHAQPAAAPESSKAAKEIAAVKAAAKATKPKPGPRPNPKAKPKPKPKPSPNPAAEAPPPPPAARPARPGLSATEAEARYQQGLALEGRGNERAALNAFLEAGESGHGLAQRKLGEIYDKGNGAAVRDYETSLKWYQKARDQGVPVAKPFVLRDGH